MGWSASDVICMCEMLGVVDVLEASVPLKVNGKLAVLAPVGGLGARASLNGEFREGGLEQTARRIDLDISGAPWAARSQKPDVLDPDGLSGPAYGTVVNLGEVPGDGEVFVGSWGCGKSGSEADEEGESRLPEHLVSGNGGDGVSGCVRLFVWLLTRRLDPRMRC